MEDFNVYLPLSNTNIVMGIIVHSVLFYYFNVGFLPEAIMTGMMRHCHRIAIVELIPNPLQTFLPSLDSVHFRKELDWNMG